MPKSIKKLEETLGYTFADIDLLRLALTHRSLVNEISIDSSEAFAGEQNERLEFVGDSILGLVVAERLFILYPDLDEGNLTLIKHRLVSAETLAQVAREKCIGEFLLIGQGEEKTGGRLKKAILADTLEAVIAAIFFDSDYGTARTFILRIFADYFAKVTPRNAVDSKTRLQELLQGEKRNPPIYRLAKTIGPPHNREFVVEAKWDTGSAEAIGKTIKDAETKAAGIALNMLDENRK